MAFKKKPGRIVKDNRFKLMKRQSFQLADESVTQKYFQISTYEYAANIEP
jgi:hypothetical protein